MFPICSVWERSNGRLLGGSEAVKTRAAESGRMTVRSDSQMDRDIGFDFVFREEDFRRRPLQGDEELSQLVDM